jgi:hypothetical protein
MKKKNRKNKKEKKSVILSMDRSERNKIYMETMMQLMDMEIWDLDDIGMKKFKIIMKLYLDKGMEFDGNINLDTISRKIIYKFFNDRRKKTYAYVSQKEYMKEREKLEKDAQDSNKLEVSLECVCDCPCLCQKEECECPCDCNCECGEH